MFIKYCNIYCGFFIYLCVKVLTFIFLFLFFRYQAVNGFRSRKIYC